MPFWTQVTDSQGSDHNHLIVPYTLDSNDMRFAAPQGFNTADHFFTYLRDAFDVLYAEGEEAPKMLSIGMHCRLLGRPGVFARCSAFWITSKPTTVFGSLAGSISPVTGLNITRQLVNKPLNRML
ncbi:hypothetical protein HSBAA_51620 [Vreelandella sulfidaeris]|uniref:NodB homology domain-containing protein n=1 Tax=Vreelandella sulfidaeris TaxID=115553 RepID=A0A455UCA3_9GAMM|nr:hypothetical protein HSBAA_51620 [Halomonas sulfidaeris]